MAWLVVVAAAAVLFLVAVTSMGIGAMSIPAGRVVALLAAEIGFEPRVLAGVDATTIARERAVLVAIRAPRVLGAVLIGASLAVSGATLQGLFRNPLADPALVGVSAGAAVATAAVIVLGGAVVVWTRPIAAFLGSLVATALVYVLATRDRRTDVATLLLAGIAVNALAGAGNGLFTFLADDAQLRDITFWTLGSLGGLTWRALAVSAPVMIVGILVLPRLARELNALLLGEREAAHIGTNVQLVKVVSVALVAAGVGASVSVSGIIGFIGLVAPHLVRLSIGPDYRTLLPGSAVLGAILLLLADLVARTIVAPAELPIGIVTALVGAPFFIWLLLRNRRRSHA
ncbi:MAG: FecCD family ABC transporter permease [Spirochaetota bacterium]